MNKISIELKTKIVQNILDRFKIKTLACNEDGLLKLYQAWCRNIPFDNFWKRFELTGAMLTDQQQMDPNHFFEIWLTHGLGGTCWTTMHAMSQLLNHLGFNTRFIGGSMGAIGSINHGSLIVSFPNGKEFIVDTSVLNEQPIELTIEEIKNKIHPIKLISKEETPVMLFEYPSKKDVMICSIDKKKITLEKIKAMYKESLTKSLFNDCVYIRKNNEQGINTIIGTTLYTKSADNIEKRILNKEERKSVLINIMGLSEEVTNHITTTNLFDIPKASNLINLIT